MAQTTINLTAMNAALKQLYTDQTVQEISYKNNPFWALLEKKENFFGSLKPLPVMISPSAGVSSTFLNAQANEAAPQITQFQLTRAKKYGLAQVDRETMVASAQDVGAFLSAAKASVNMTMRGVTNSLCTDLFRSGTGSIGAISTISTGVITLTNAQDVVGFELNMVVNANATDGGTPRAAKGFVVAIDRAAGKLTVSTSLGGAAATPTGWQAADFLLRDGDNNATVKGLAAWLPAVAPTAGDNFFGVDRSVDPTRLAGVRYNGAAQSIEEALIDAASLLQREGGSPDVAVLGPASFANLTKALSTRLVYGEASVGEFGFQYIKLATPAGEIKVFQDRSCPALVGYLLQMDTWAFSSAGPAPEIQKDMSTGNMLRVSNADAGELRISLYGQLECVAPGFNATISLSA